MDEIEAVSRETQFRLEAFASLVVDENQRQNLISPATVATIWERHIVDSLQLMPYLRSGMYVDLGTGAGFPGMVLAIALKLPTTLIEPRGLRAAFLQRAVEALNLDNVVVFRGKAEDFRAPGVATITARAVASLGKLFAMSDHFATPQTRFVLPKGKSANSELAEAARAWQGAFRVEESRTDPAAMIIIAENVRAKGKP